MAGKVRLVDLSLEIKQGVGIVPPELESLGKTLSATVDYQSHEQCVTAMLQNFPGVDKNDLPKGLAWANEKITLSTHSGTHIDAPYHYHPTSEGKKSKTIDQMPLEWAYGNGVVLDMRHKKAGEVITVDDIQKFLKKVKYQLKPLDIVMVMTGADKLWDTAKYWTDYPGPGRDATIWLVDQGIRVVGTDAAGWDRPFMYQAKAFQQTHDRKLIWEGHYAGIDREYYQMEKLANLDKLPPFGFKVYCFPVKILNAGAAWLRPVAIVEE